MKLKLSEVERRAKELGYLWQWDSFGEFIVWDPDGKVHSYWCRDEISRLKWSDIILSWHVKERLKDEQIEADTD